MQAEIGTQIEVVLHSDRGGFARGPRWFCMQLEVNLHVDRGGFARRSRWFWICMHPRPYGLYRSEADFGNCAKKGILSPVSEIYRVYTQKSRFSQGFQIQLQFLHSGIQTEKCSQNLPDTQKGIHVHT
jgi:hypothetical protein